MKGKPRQMRLHIKCPNCGTPSSAFKTRELTGVTTEVAYNCNNETCGSSFVVNAEVSRYLRMPSWINPAVNVPLSPIVQRRQLANALEVMGMAKLPDQGEIITLDEAQRQGDMFDLVGSAHGP